MNPKTFIPLIGLAIAAVTWAATGPTPTTVPGTSWDIPSYTTNKSTVTVSTSTNMQVNSVSDAALSSISNSVQKVLVMGGTNEITLTQPIAVVPGTNSLPFSVNVTNNVAIKNATSETLSVAVTNYVNTIAPIIVSTNIMVPLTNAITAGYAWAACTNTLFRTGVSNGIIQSFSISGPTNGALNIWTISTTNVAIPTYNTAWQPSITEQPYIRLLTQSTNFTWVPLGTNYNLHCDHLARTFENKDGENKVYFIITAGAGNTMSNYTSGNTFFVTAGAFSN